jgi:hypothetical protein
VPLHPWCLKQSHGFFWKTSQDKQWCAYRCPCAHTARNRMSLQCSDPAPYVLLLQLAKQRTLEEVKALMKPTLVMDEAVAWVKKQVGQAGGEAVGQVRWRIKGRDSAGQVCWRIQGRDSVQQVYDVLWHALFKMLHSLQGTAWVRSKLQHRELVPHYPDPPSCQLQHHRIPALQPDNCF